MANLWKDGDVITAEKLNRFVIAHATTTEENNQTITTLDITPNDVFDNDNQLNSFIIISGQVIGKSTIEGNFAIVCNWGYVVLNDLYMLSAIEFSDNEKLHFDAPSRTDYFVAVIDDNTTY